MNCSESLEAIAGCIAAVIINPLIALIFGAGVLVFIWGLVEYLYGLNVKGDAKSDTGKKHMLYGLLGMFIMIAVFGIIRIIAATVGATSRLPSGF